MISELGRKTGVMGNLTSPVCCRASVEERQGFRRQSEPDDDCYRNRVCHADRLTLDELEQLHRRL